jgi:hypothetical protein
MNTFIRRWAVEPARGDVGQIKPCGKRTELKAVRPLSNARGCTCTSADQQSFGRVHRVHCSYLLPGICCGVGGCSYYTCQSRVKPKLIEKWQ